MSIPVDITTQKSFPIIGSLLGDTFLKDLSSKLSHKYNALWLTSRNSRKKGNMDCVSSCFS